MDPLSILVSSITLLGACITVADRTLCTIAKFRHLSNELLATSNDVADFKLVLMDIHEVSVEEERILNSLRLERPGQPLLQDVHIATANPQTQRMLERARDKLAEIEEVLRKTNTMSKKETIRRARLAATDRLKVLREELRDIKVNISAYFSVKGRYVV